MAEKTHYNFRWFQDYGSAAVEADSVAALVEIDGAQPHVAAEARLEIQTPGVHDPAIISQSAWFDIL